MAEYVLTDAQIMQIAYRVRGLIRAESRSVPEVPMVGTLEGIESFPVVQKIGGVSKYVRAPVSLLGQPAWDAVAGYIQRLEDAIESIDDTVAEVIGASDAVADLKATIAAAKLATSNATSASSSATASARTADNSAASTDAVRLQALAVLEILRQMIAEGRAEVENMQAIRDMVVADAQLAPSRMEVAAPARITVTNRAAQRIEAKVFPAYLVQNILYQQPVGGGASVAVAPDGSLEVLGVGKSRIHVIPANNTRLWQTVEIEVRPPVARLTTTGRVRLTSGGKLRIA
jgi:hypothetical protein